MMLSESVITSTQQSSTQSLANALAIAGGQAVCLYCTNSPPLAHGSPCWPTGTGRLGSFKVGLYITKD